MADSTPISPKVYGASVDVTSRNNSSSARTLTLGVVGVFILIALGIVALLFMRGNKTGSAAPTSMTPLSPTTTPITYRGALTISQDAPTVPVTVGKPVTFTVTGSSAGLAVTGYDLIVSYNQASMEYTDVQSLLPDFKTVAPYKQGNYLSFTVFKDIASKTKTVFGNKAILRLTFTPKTKGQLTVGIVESYGKQTTKMVDDSASPQVLRTRASIATVKVD